MIMATREIKTRFRLEGESEYRRAMKESADAVKVLASEQKLAAAEYEATGDAQQYASETARILKDQIREQERAVQAAQQAVEKLRAAGVDPADKSMQQWNTRLNTAKTRLLNMQTQLGKANTDMQENKGKLDESEGSAKGFGDQLERIGKNIDFTATITAIENIQEKIEGVIKTAARAVKAVWDMETDAGKWADDLKTAASKAGMDVETYQSWQYASQFIDTEVSTIISSVTRLEKDLGSENEEIAKAFNQLGVRTREAGGNVRSATEVFWDVIDALKGIEDPTRRSILAQKVLGQSWKDLNPLIEEGSKAYQDLVDEGRKSAAVSEENVNKLAAMNDAQTDLNASIQKAKFEALASLAPTFEKVSNALKTAVDSLNEFLQSEAGQEALGNLNEALSGVIESFLGEDGGKGTFASIVEGASGALETFNNALQWIQNNGGVVEGIVLGLAAAWGGLEITKSVLTFMQLLQHIPTEKLSSIFGGGAAASSSGAAASSSGAADAGTSAVSNAVKSASTAGMSAAADALLGIGTAAGVTLIALTPAILAEKHLREQTTKTLEGVRESATKAAEAIGKDAEAAVATVNAAVTALGISKEHYDVFGQGVLADVKEVNEALREAASNTPEQYLSGKTRLLLNRQQEQGLSGMQEDELLYKIMEEAADSLINPKAQQATDDLAGTISDALDDILAIQEALDETKTPENIEALYSLIDQIVDNKDLLDSLSESTKDLLGAYYDEESGYGAGSANQFSDAQELLETLMEDLESAYDRAREEGNNVSGGIADGIQEGQSAIEGAANDAAGGAATGAEERLSDGSMETIGYNASIGLANGIISGQDAVINAATAVAQSAADTMQSVLDIHSPSRVMMRLGAFTGEGFAKGVEESISRVQAAASRMAGAAFRAPVEARPQAAAYQAASAPVGASGAPGSVSGQQIQAVIMMDKKTVGYMVAPVVNEAIGAIVQEARA